MPVIAAEADLGTCTPHPFAHLMIGQRQASAPPTRPCSRSGWPFICALAWSANSHAGPVISPRQRLCVIPRHADVRALRNERLRPREANPSTQLLATLLIHSSGALVRVDRDRRYAADWHDRVDRDGCAEGRLRRVTPSFQPLEGRSGLSARVEKLRAWFAPTDGEDALWLWLPRCSW